MGHFRFLPPNHWQLLHRLQYLSRSRLYTTSILRVIQREMSSKREDSVPHELRTAAEPRQNKLYNARLSYIHQVNPSVRLLRLTIPKNQDEEEQQPFTFLPGQWLDVHIPSVPQAGGFTITSTPADAQILPSPEPPTESLSVEEESLPPVRPRGREPYVELAVQKSPFKSPAAWLWRTKEEILGQQLSIRVGGSFVWPPTGIELGEIGNVVFVAGGVGINPLISIISHLNNSSSSSNDEDKIPSLPGKSDIHFLYSTRLPQETSSATTTTTTETLDQILFLPRLRQIIQSQSHSRRLRISLDLFITDLHSSSSSLSNPRANAMAGLEPGDLTIHPRRINEEDLRGAVLGDDKSKSEVVAKRSTVCYVCGPPDMTDHVVGLLKGILAGAGDEKERVFYEKWW